MNFKIKLLPLILQTETLNPFELMNGDISSPLDNYNIKTSRLLTAYQNMDSSQTTTTTSAGPGGADDKNNNNSNNNGQESIGDSNFEEDANNNITNTHELMDMRRQLVYLQVLLTTR